VSRCDCLCVGIAVADFVCAPAPVMPPPGGLVMTNGISLAIGGCASNVAVDLARLGRQSAVAGLVGADPPGRFIRESLETAGVDTTRLLETPQAQTSSTLVINIRGEDRRFIHAAGANALFTGDELTADLITSARVLYLGGFCLMPKLTGEKGARLFQMARKAGIPTVLDVVIPDPHGWEEELRKILPWTDVFLPNTDEAWQLTGLDDPCRQAEHFASLGAATTIVTCGKEGAVLIDARRRLRSRSFSVDFVDGTGSGDAFTAGYIHALLEGLPPERCLEAGSALGASCVRSPGATTGVFTRPELERFLSENQLECEPWG
jgi:sugar/nucleoside kinase (ribokinase family)